MPATGGEPPVLSYDPVSSWVEYHARHTPHRVALVDLHRGRTTTYADLAARARSLAWSLADHHGIGAGDRVAVLSRNDTRVFEVLYACAVLGAIAVPLNWRLTTTELTAITIDAQPRMSDSLATISPRSSSRAVRTARRCPAAPRPS